MTKYLGIDYGQSHLGLATSESILATPLPSLSNNEQMYHNLLKLVRSEDITTIVCGIPEGRLAGEVEQFAAKLKETTGLEVHLHQETLTTHEAKQKLRESGASKTKRRNDHSYAACLILEDFLEFKNSVN